MSYEYKSGYCYTCEANRKLERKTTNHILHLLITIFTVGLWAIVWILISIKFGGWRCTTCGSSNVSGIRSDSVINQIAESQTVSKLSLILSWVFGIFFFLLGVIVFISIFQTGYKNIVVSIMFFSFSFLLLPPVRKFAYEKTNITLNVRAKQGAFSLIFFIVVIVFVIFASLENKDIINENEIPNNKSIVIE